MGSRRSGAARSADRSSCLQSHTARGTLPPGRRQVLRCDYPGPAGGEVPLDALDGLPVAGVKVSSGHAAAGHGHWLGRLVLYRVVGAGNPGGCARRVRCAAGGRQRRTRTRHPRFRRQRRRPAPTTDTAPARHSTLSPRHQGTGSRTLRHFDHHSDRLRRNAVALPAAIGLPGLPAPFPTAARAGPVRTAASQAVASTRALEKTEVEPTQEQDRQTSLAETAGLSRLHTHPMYR